MPPLYSLRELETIIIIIFVCVHVFDSIVANNNQLSTTKGHTWFIRWLRPFAGIVRKLNHEIPTSYIVQEYNNTRTQSIYYGETNKNDKYELANQLILKAAQQSNSRQ